MPTLLPVGTILKRNATGHLYRVAEGSDERMLNLEPVSGAPTGWQFEPPADVHYCYSEVKD